VVCLQALVMAARAPLVLDLPSSVLLARAEQLAGVTGFPTEQVVFLYARQPALLDYSPEQLTGAAGAISAILGCSQQGVVQLLARMDRPGLRSVLTMPPHLVPARLQELVDSLGLPESSTNRLDIMRLVVSLSVAVVLLLLVVLVVLLLRQLQVLHSGVVVVLFGGPPEEPPPSSHGLVVITAQPLLLGVAGFCLTQHVWCRGSC
jgi:hypothetical protein